MTAFSVPGRARWMGVLLLLWLLCPVVAVAPSAAARPASRSSFAGMPSGPVPQAYLAGAGPVDPYAIYSSEPAPMGIADYGLGPTGAYQYSTNSSLGAVTIAALSTRNSTGGRGMSFQLNVNLHYTSNAKLYDYWVQDVAIVDTGLNEIAFYDNLWNHTARNSVMKASGVTGGGRVVTLAGVGSYYEDAAAAKDPGNGVAMTYPTTVYFRVNSTLASRRPAVTFQYNDGQGWVLFDEITFTSATALGALPGFTVNGLAYNGFGTYDDAELVMGGPYGGLQTSVVSSDVRLQLKYWNGHDYQSVQNAYNFGSDTAETLNDAKALYFYYPDNGEVVSDVAQGSGTLAKLFDPTTTAALYVDPGFSTGLLSIRNASEPGATPSRYPFVGGEAIVVLYPGTWLLQTFLAGTFFRAGTVTLSAGQSVQTSPGEISFTANFTVVGGGSGYSPPTISYTSNGARQTAPMTTAPTTYFMDLGTPWSASTVLGGSTSNERWASGSTEGVAGISQTVTIQYYHQFDLAVSYTLAGGGSPGNPTLTYDQFGAAGSIVLSSFAQTVWSDSGSAYSATNPLPGSSDRERWFAQSSGGTSTGAAELSFPYSHQYFLTVSGAGLSSQWYDSSSTAVLSPPGVYNRTSDSGERVVSYSLDGGSPIKVPPSAGALNVQIIVDGPHTVAFNSVSQYLLALGQGAEASLVSITPPPITGDAGWYDQGSSVDVSSLHTWGLVANQSRMNAVAYSLDGTRTGITRASGGTFDTTVLMASPHTFDVLGATQYLVYLTLVAATGKAKIVPTTFLVTVGSPVSVDARNGSVWADDGTTLGIESVVWHGSEVKPDNFSLVVSGPKAVTVSVKVYNGAIRVTDPLGLPVGGAGGQITLANGTSIDRVTAADGTISLPEIPLGTFNATISSFGESVQVLGNAASAPVTDVTVVLSLNIIGILAGVVVVAYLLWYALRRRRKGKAPTPPPYYAPTSDVQTPATQVSAWLV